MSVSKWAYSPELCDGERCPGDCDLCSKMEGNNMTEEELKSEINRLKTEIAKLREKKKAEKREQPACPSGMDKEFNMSWADIKIIGRIVREYCFGRNLDENRRYRFECRSAQKLSAEEYRFYEAMLREICVIIAKNYCEESCHAASCKEQNERLRRVEEDTT